MHLVNDLHGNHVIHKCLTNFGAGILASVIMLCSLM
ncbi:hypothetical protein BRADI_4g22435v3 [Brachypodium distachyon]|uniref:Uncharacterized protein n=1 Tax=Brachypodium distachyon TaxID=15368 RepID=A0A0Q3HL42_BRADI|nr:hypothetical protein BRADI_4g22435v3 [Brachypodium distachyon]